MPLEQEQRRIWRQLEAAGKAQAARALLAMHGAGILGDEGVRRHVARLLGRDEPIAWLQLPLEEVYEHTQVPGGEDVAG